MRKADTTIKYVEPYSVADEAGLEAGDRLIKINDREFHDILEYRYLTAEYEVTLEVQKKNGDTEIITVENDYDDLGIEFADGLIDEAQSCTNKCIFCFIDQLPKGMRETVYFKDDDTRLSFLQGNYVTLTNLSDEEIDSLIEMRVSPINVSVHATEPELRCKMLNNRFAGKCFAIMKRFAQNGIVMNCQIVLCPEINDGEHLLHTLHDLGSLFPSVNSISVVPVGLTRYRDGLYPIKPFTKATSAETIDFVREIQDEFLKKYGTRLVYLSDEFYVNAGVPVPDSEDYEGFPQIENGVGLIASMREEFDSAVRLLERKPRNRRVSVATGEIAADFISELAEKLERVCEGVKVDVYPVKNNFFGGGVTVSGLVCGCDITEQLKGKIQTDELLIPRSMLRDDDNIFLDDTTVREVEKELGVKITPVTNDGYEFVEKVLDEEVL